MREPRASMRRPSVLQDYDLSDSLKDLFDDVPETSEMIPSSSFHQSRNSLNGSKNFHFDLKSVGELSGGSTHRKSLLGSPNNLLGGLGAGSDHSGTMTFNSILPSRGSGVQTAYGRRGLGLTKRQSVRDMTQAFEAKRVKKAEKEMQMPIKKKEKKPNYLPNIVGDLKASIAGRDVFENYDHKKKANSICRWNLLWLVMLLFAPYPLWLTFLDCRLAYELTIIVNLIMTVNFVYTTVLCWRYMWRMIRAFNTPFWEELDPEVRQKVQHIVVMPTYKEPVELLLETISSIANQTVADSIILVVGMEERTPEQESKKKQINEQFGETFKALIYAVHPSGVPGEIPGACSNRNYAARTAVKHMIREGMLPVDPTTKEVDLDFTMVTVCDADTTFYYRYFENLTWLFLNEDPKTRFQVCWQSPLFYNISLDQRWFFTRVMGILRSYFMIGFLIGCDINTMSIYSQSLRLLVQSRYFHPGYQMDDIIYTLSAMKATGKRIRIRVIDIPTLSGPTSGDTMWKELDEWIIQSTRWTIGAAEVFHYFFVKLLRGNYFLPGFAYFWWFVYYYGFVLCVAGLINISNTVIQLVSIVSLPELAIETCRPFGFDADVFPYAWVFPGFLLITYVMVYGTAFFMDALVVQVLALAEEISPLRNFGHYLSCQLVLWLYCLVEYKSIFTIAIYGKKVCGHKASEKGSLVKSDPNKPPVKEEDPESPEKPTPPSDPQPSKRSSKGDEPPAFTQTLPSIIDEEGSSSSSSSFSFASSSSSSSTSKDSWHDEEQGKVAPLVDVSSAKNKQSYSEMAASGKKDANVGAVLTNLDESCRRLENRFQQKLSERKLSINMSSRGISMDNSDRNSDRKFPTDVEAPPSRPSVVLSRRVSNDSTVAATNVAGTRPLPTIPIQKEISATSFGSKKYDGDASRESVRQVDATPSKQPMRSMQSFDSRNSAVNGSRNPQQESYRGSSPVPPLIGIQKESSSVSPKREVSVMSFESRSSSAYAPPPPKPQQEMPMSNGYHHREPYSYSPPPPPAVKAEASSLYDSAWMHEDSNRESVTRRPLILQLLDWNRNNQDKSGSHGYSTPFMTGVMNGLDAETYQEPVQPAMVVYSSYLRR